VRSIPAILHAYGFDEPKAAQRQLRRSSSWIDKSEQSGYSESPQERPSCGYACSLIVRAKGVLKKQKTFCFWSPWFFHFAAWRCSRITRSKMP
jgi:hypothetical protein